MNVPIFIAVTVIAVLIGIIAASNITLPPSCEERGGKNVYTHTLLIPMMVGKVMIQQQHPQYKCVMPEPNNG